MEPLSVERDVVQNGVRLDCVFEGYEYRPEREEVRNQRLTGAECPEIAEKTGLPLEQIISYCRELGLPESGNCHLMPPKITPDRRCPVCGRIAAQKGAGGLRRFCSEECKKEYFSRYGKKGKTSRLVICKNCGREFRAVDEQRRERKFCSLNCYWDYRYGMKEATEDE